MRQIAPPGFDCNRRMNKAHHCGFTLVAVAFLLIAASAGEATAANIHLTRTVRAEDLEIDPELQPLENFRQDVVDEGRMDGLGDGEDQITVEQRMRGRIRQLLQRLKDNRLWNLVVIVGNASAVTLIIMVIVVLLCIRRKRGAKSEALADVQEDKEEAGANESRVLETNDEADDATESDEEP